MKKYKLSLLLICVIATNVFGQTQLKRWTIGDNNTTFDMTVNPPTSWSSMRGNNPPIIKNSMHDALGRVLFYVGDYKIYDGFGNVVGTMDDIPNGLGNPSHFYDINPEYPIVPCIEQSTECKKRYYVFYTMTDYQARNLKLFAKIVTVDNNTGDVTTEDVKNPQGERRILDYSATYAFSNNWQRTGLAVSTIKQQWIEGSVTEFVPVRYLYWVAGEVKKITIGPFNNTDFGLGASNYIFRIYNGVGFQFNTNEADLSHDGKKLVWGSVESNTNNHRYYYIELNDNGDWDGVTDEVFLLATPSPNTFETRGVEFTPDGETLLVSTGGSTPGVHGDHGIYYKPLVPLTSGFNFIQGTGAYGASQLELAQNGFIYAASERSTHLGYAGVDLHGFTFPNGIINSGFNNTGKSFFDIYSLPDQIDGEDYNSHTQIDFYDVGDISFQGIGGSHMLTIDNSNVLTYFPHIGNQIKVRGTIQFVYPNIPNVPTPPRSFYTLSMLDFSMAKGSKIIVGDNVTVTLIGTTFRSASCAEMWKGIQVIGTGQLVIFSANSPLTANEFYDAETAINVSGGNAKLSLNGAIFNRNETHVSITDYSPYNSAGIDIMGNKFSHTEDLRIFSNGERFPASGVLGTTSISLKANTGTPNAPPPQIGITHNEFIGGKYGIVSVKAPLKLFNNGGPNRFRNMDAVGSIAIKVENVLNGNVDIGDCLFEDIYQAFNAKGYNTIDFYSNTVTRSTHHAVEIYSNRNREIKIRGNLFIDFRSGAVLLNNNSGYQNGTLLGSGIKIFNNTFEIATRPPLNLLDKAVAITIMEPTMDTTFATYMYLRVNNNTMKGVACGILTNTIMGTQLTNKQYNPIYTGRNDICDFDHNTIEVDASFTLSTPAPSDYNTGIRLINSKGLVSVVNTIKSNQFTQWRSSGIYSDNSRQSLFFSNIITAGRGIGATNYGIGNDIKCNTFAVGVNGISLEDYRMRQQGQLHGQRFLDSRDNTYSLMKKECIELYLYRKPASLIQNHIDANQWLMNSVPTALIEPTPSCAPFINCIRQVGAPNNCGGNPQYDHGGDKTSLTPPPMTPSGDNLFDWQLRYEYERQQKDSGAVSDTLLSKLIDVEHFIAIDDNSSAALLLNSMHSNNVYEANLIQLYGILVNARLDDERPLDSPEIVIYKEIAEQNVYAVGPAIYLARGVLWQQEGLNYVDMVDRNSGNIGIKLNAEGCTDVITNEFLIQLIDEDENVYTDISLNVDEEGYVFIPNSVVATLPQGLNFTFLLDGGNYPSPPFQTLAEWMDNDDNVIYLCSSSALGKKTDKDPHTEVNQNFETNAEIARVTIYPNPANNFLTVLLPDNNEYTIEVYDIVGRSIYEQKHSRKAVITTDNYKSGVYLIKVNDSKGVSVCNKKIIIQK